MVQFIVGVEVDESIHNVEHLAHCLRFVDANFDIWEEFLSFLKLERMRATDITDAIGGTLEGLGLPLQDLRGQGTMEPLPRVVKHQEFRNESETANQSLVHSLCWALSQPLNIEFLFSSSNEKLYWSNKESYPLNESLCKMRREIKSGLPTWYPKWINIILCIYTEFASRIQLRILMAVNGCPCVTHSQSRCEGLSSMEMLNARCAMTVCLQKTWKMFWLPSNFLRHLSLYMYSPRCSTLFCTWRKLQSSSKVQSKHYLWFCWGGMIFCRPENAKRESGWIFSVYFLSQFLKCKAIRCYCGNATSESKRAASFQFRIMDKKFSVKIKCK